LAGGNLRLIAALTSGLKILYSSKVKKIKYSIEGVAVTTGQHIIKGTPHPPLHPCNCSMLKSSIADSLLTANIGGPSIAQ
jgi:hypothetical protein